MECVSYAFLLCTITGAKIASGKDSNLILLLLAGSMKAALAVAYSKA